MPTPRKMLWRTHFTSLAGLLGKVPLIVMATSSRYTHQWILRHKELHLCPLERVSCFKQGEKAPKYIFSGPGSFTASVPASGDDGPLQAQGRPLRMINLSKLCVHPVSIRDIYLPTGWKFCWTFTKMHFSRLWDTFPRDNVQLGGQRIGQE